MATSFSFSETSLWPPLGQTVADLAQHQALERETMGAGVIARTLDRMNGLETTGAPSITQNTFGGMVAGNFLDTIPAGSLGPRDAVAQIYDVQRGLMTVHTGNGILVDSLA